MYVFISCVKTKRKERCKAEDLYISNLFRKSLQYAKTLTSESKIFILSAKYGALRLHDIVAPYELCLNNFNVMEQKRWAYKVFKQLTAYGVNFREETTFLCGVHYRKYIAQKFPNHTIPLAGLSMGNQLKFYKEVLGDEKKPK